MQTLTELAGAIRNNRNVVTRLEWPNIHGGSDMRYFVNDQEVADFETVHLLIEAYRDNRFAVLPVGSGKDKLIASKVWFDD